MPSAPKQATLFDGVRRLIVDEGVTAAIFSTVLAATILAFGFGATADIVASMLILGTLTAFAEARLRARK
jgi:hypothetical protein